MANSFTITNYEWSWLSDYGWVPYDPQSQAILEQAFLAASPTVTLHIPSGAYIINLGNMTQKNVNTGYIRRVQRAPRVTPPPTTSSTVKWQWFDDYKWVDYDQQTSAILEQAYSSGSPRVTLSHGYFGQRGGYVVDFTTMVQTRSATGYSRNVQRIGPPLARGPSSVSSTQPPLGVIPPANSISNATLTASTPISFPSAPMPTFNSVNSLQASTAPLSSSSNPTSTTPMWYVSNENGGGWIPIMDSATRKLLELSASSGRSDVTLTHGSFLQRGGAVVNFKTMELTFKKDNQKLYLRRDPPLKLSASVAAALTPQIEENSSMSTEADETDKGKYSAIKKLTQWKLVKASEKSGDCSICLVPLSEGGRVVTLGKCKGHSFHRKCIAQCYKNSYLKCPLCNVVYGIMTGDQPNGTMTVTRTTTALPGYKCGTIVIQYHFPNGIQGPEHPNPGRPYYGTTRIAYLPDNEEGNLVLRMLQCAFNRRLLFRIGQSVTTGADNCVIWNGTFEPANCVEQYAHPTQIGVHHKTSMTGGPSNFGYPDETYLERVKDELAQKGVTPDNID